MLTSRRWLAVVGIVLLLAGLAPGQLVPLELDQTITLPDTSSVWDIMPHPDGYYVWVQARTLDTLHIGVTWGRTDSGEQDTLLIAGDPPHYLATFFRGNYDPCLLLTTYQQWFASYSDSDRMATRIYNLESHQPDSATWLLESHSGFSDFHNLWSRVPHYVLGAVASPPPPAVSTTLPIVAGFTLYHQWQFPGGQGTSWSAPFLLVRNALRNISAVDTTLTGDATALGWALGGDSTWLALSGRSSAAGSTGGPGYTRSTAALRILLTADTVLRIPPNIPWSYEADDYRCHGSCLAATYSPAHHALMVFANLEDACMGYQISATGERMASWDTPGGYAFWLAAECVPGNETEEFLCYSAARRVFDVYDAVDGRWFGVTDSATAIAESRIVGRYDSTSRRLALREGNQLRLYRFGEYLPAERALAALPASFALSAFPNPFNPATEIRFTLPRAGRIQLAVYDLTGRRVQVLVDGVWSAGEQRVRFDGTGLASGIYLARLENGGIRQTQKLVLLR